MGPTKRGGSAEEGSYRGGPCYPGRGFQAVLGPQHLRTVPARNWDLYLSEEWALLAFGSGSLDAPEGTQSWGSHPPEQAPPGSAGPLGAQVSP